jgi:very-short-patch-repair endonuclease
MTEAEKALWKALRAHRFEGVQFRRQAPMGPYIVDFVAHDAKLVIELDGGQHGTDEGRAKDGERDAWLGARGYRVLRFWNAEVLTNLEGVLMMVGAALPPSQPSPAGGEGLAAGIEDAPNHDHRPDVALPPSQPSPAGGEGLAAGIDGTPFLEGNDQ